MSDAIQTSAAPHVVALRIASPRALLPAMEPSVGGRGALDPEIAAHIASGARQAGRGRAVVLRVEAEQGTPAEIEAVLRAGLRASAVCEGEAIRELFRWGWKVLAIGLVVLTTCLTIAAHGKEVLPGVALPTIVKEGMKIVGWAAMWKPTEMFFYDWIPMLRRRQTLERLASARIEVHPAKA
jgi:hypothetical protein